ncbi:Polycystic kidney disease protein 1-like 2, partial [Stylophora pistillata]
MARKSVDHSAKTGPRSYCKDGGRRKKRSCVGSKDPPPIPTPKPVILLPDFNASTDLNYTLVVSIGSCFYWSEEKEYWTEEGCKIEPEVVSGNIYCQCNHLSSFGGEFFVEPNRIEFHKVFGEFTKDLRKNFVVLATVCSMLLIYLIGLVFTRRADRQDKQKIIPNVYLPAGDEEGQHLYHISIQTGMWIGNGTTASVGMILYGEDSCSDMIVLNDPTFQKSFFSRGSINTFTISLPRRLGPLYKVKVWHDNSGESPGWFLQDLVITEVESQEKWYILAKRWLAVERGEGEVEVELKTSNKKDVSSFKNLFYFRASKQLTDEHLWISVFAKPPQSPFTRTQRFSCCMSVFFSAMITNAIFYDFGQKPHDTFQIGPLTMSWTQGMKNTTAFWNWTRQKLVPGLFLSDWYNGKQVNLNEGFISSGYPFLVGMPRLRQIRVKAESCLTDDYIKTERCLSYYSSHSEDKTTYNLRDWTPIYNISEFEASFDNVCPKPWRYRTAHALEALPFNGFYATYDGGGYVADLGYNAESALGVIDDLENNDWIDFRTFAVFVEFTVYEPSSTLFSPAKYLFERYPTGGSKMSTRIDTLMIFYPTDPAFRSFYLACYFLLIVFLLGLLLMEIFKLFNQGWRYVTHFWNLIDVFQVISAAAALVSFFFKAKYTSNFVKRVRENPFATSSSDYIVLWCAVETWLLSLVVFVVTVKFLRLLKFNDHICHFAYTVKSAFKHLFSYSMVFAAAILAYTQLGTLLFGSNVSAYSNLTKSLIMLLERLLGNNMYTNELKAANQVMAQLFTFGYSLSIAMILLDMFFSILHSSYCQLRRLKQGRFPDVELARFAWRYFMEKARIFWYDTKHSTKENKLRRLRFNKRQAEVVGFLDKDSEFDDEAAEEYICLPSEDVRFEEVVLEKIEDIDLVDEYNSLKE